VIITVRRRPAGTDRESRKSQIAIEFAHRMRSELPGKSVFWVHAGTRARFEDGYRRIAQMTKMAGWDDPREDILRLVHDWLCDESNGQWTLVVDNADDASLLFYNRSRSHTLPNPDQSTQLLSKFLPQSPNGSILLTSRSHDVGQRFTDSYSSVVEVKPMEDNDALALLEKKLPSKIIRQEAIQLIHTLDAMPLALTQAAAYITRRAPRMSILRYLEEIRKSERDRAHLLETDLGDNRRDVHASNSIIATWQISFEYIRKQTPSATRLLSLISMFDRQAIPESLLQDRYRSDSEGEVHFEDDMATLSNFSLIKTNEDGSEFEMHRLVQFSTKKWLEYNGEQEEWTSVYSMLMDASFPLGEYENWTVCRALLPHVQSLKDNKPADKQGLIAWASVLYKTAWYMIEMGQYSDALQLNITAVEVRNRVLGVEHAHTLDCHNDIGRALRAQGKYTKAELVHAEALRVRSRVLGQDHSDTLRSMHNLAETYQTQGRWDDAQKLQVQVVEKRKIKLGEDHSETLISLNCLAGIYQSQGRWDEAEKLQIQVVEKSRNKLGEDHPDTLISIDNLAGMYKRQRRWDEAEKLQIEVVEKSKKIIGVDHPSTLTSMGNLSRTYCNRGWWDGAEELQVWVKEKRKIKLGEDHPDTLQSMSNLAVTWHAQGRNVEALELMQDCVQRSRRVLGDSHPETVDFWYYLEMWELESVPSD
jgi:tetratricopeptide (TPR) repeat protein